MLELFILGIVLLSFAIAFGTLAFFLGISLLLVLPFLFLYMLLLGSVLWLFEVNTFLGIVGFLAVAVLFSYIKKKRNKIKAEQQAEKELKERAAMHRERYRYLEKR